MPAVMEDQRETPTARTVYDEIVTRTSSTEDVSLTLPPEAWAALRFALQDYGRMLSVDWLIVLQKLEEMGENVGNVPVEQIRELRRGLAKQLAGAKEVARLLGLPR